MRAKMKPRVNSVMIFFRQKLALLILAGALLAAFGWMVMTHGPLAPVKVTVEKIQIQPLAPEVFGVGTVEARHTYPIAPVMTGRLAHVWVDQGSRVRAGQVLAEIDPIDLNERLASSRLMIARIASNLKVTEAQLTEARSRSQLASTTYARFSNLQAQGFISPDMLDAKLHEKTAAHAAVAGAAAAVAAAQQDYAKSQVDAEGVTKLRNQTQLRSPIDGVVIVRLAEVGSILLSGQAVLQVVADQDLWIKTRIDQQQSGALRVGQSAQIVLRAQPDTAVLGQLERIDLVSDSVTEERIVNVGFASNNVSVGEYAEVTVKLPVVTQARTIASAAVKHLNQQTGVWLYQQGRAQFRAVTTGITTPTGRTQILAGLRDQDEVIVYSQQAMRDEMKVKVVAEIVRATP